MHCWLLNFCNPVFLQFHILRSDGSGKHKRFWGVRNTRECFLSCLNRLYRKPRDLPQTLFYDLFIIISEYTELSPDPSEELVRSLYRWLWGTMCLLGIEPKSIGRAISASNHRAISSDPLWINIKSTKNQNYALYLFHGCKFLLSDDIYDNF